ncbi:g6332 [Coccomyxa elongata]
MRLGAVRSSFHRIGPDRSVIPELISDKHCVLRQIHAVQNTPSRAAESVAAVAMNSFGSSPTGDVVLGSSPEGSFEHEMLRFMQGTVASKPRRRRSSRSLSSGGAHGESTRVYHLCYVHRPMPTARHPLQGLWKGDYGPNGVQVVQIMYDFTGSAARLVATKVTGDDHVPPGRRTWHALAAPLAEPWSREESDLIDLKDMLASRSSLDSTPDSEEPPPCNVVAVFAGKGKVAGLNYIEPRWVDGRLWQYDNGGIGFLWIDPVFQHLLVDLKRIDDDFR